MGLRERLGLGAAPPIRSFPEALERDTWFGKPPVGPSEDLNRIVALPRRIPKVTPAEIAELEARFRLAPHEAKCACGTFNPPRPCPTSLKPIQAQALLEAERFGKVFVSAGAGSGKTLIDMLLPWVMRSRTAVLFLPATLLDKFLTLDWRYYGGHWRMPNLVGGNWFQSGRPILHVMSYERLSRQEGETMLLRIKPDLFLLDEAHKAKNPDGPRWNRIKRCRAKIEPRPRLVPLSGTFATRGISDCLHLADASLDDGSPYPRHKGTGEEWGRALDPVVNDASPASAPGALVRLEGPDFSAAVQAEEAKTGRELNPTERARLAFRLRRNETPGVVATTTSAFEGTLLIRRRMPGPIPAKVLELIETAKKGKRPDGEESKEKVQGYAWARQIACGFFHRWRFPRGEPEELIERWRNARREWHRAIRKKLEHPREHMDTPGLLENAARRAYDPTYDGDLPRWRAPDWPAWNEVADLVQPVTSTVWLDKGCPGLAPIPGSDFLVNDAVTWAHDKTEGPGIVWVEFPELGERIARAAGVPYFGEGKQATIDIQLEKGDRSIVASMNAHREGKDLQFAFWRNYFTSPYADGGAWEQAIARTHRPGQKADMVIVDVAQHVEDFERSFANARERARFGDQNEGQPQKLLLADYEW